MKRKESTITLIFWIFGILGIVLLAVGVLLLTSGIKFGKNAVEIQAVITDIQTYRSGDDTHHSVWVEYEYDGKVYKDVQLNEYSSGMRRGKKITLLVDPENPERVSTKFGTVLAGGLLILMGVIFFCVGFIPTVVWIKKSRLRKKLIAEGRFIYAKVESIVHDTSLRVNGSSPYVVYCTYQDEYRGVMYRFKSGNIWKNPEYFLQPGSDIRIYVNGEDYSKYYVDVESMLENKIIDYT